MKAVLGFSGDGDRGNLMENLVSALSERGIFVSVLIETDADYDLDRPGKDSFLHRQAGASEVMVSSTHRWALLHENKTRDDLPDISLFVEMSDAQVLLVEGFDSYAMDRLWVLNAEPPKDQSTQSRLPSSAVAAIYQGTDQEDPSPSNPAKASCPKAQKAGIPAFSATALDPLADFLLERYGLTLPSQAR